MIVTRNKRAPSERTFNHPVFMDLSQLYHELYELSLEKINKNSELTEEDFKNIFAAIRRMGNCIKYIESRSLNSERKCYIELDFLCFLMITPNARFNLTVPLRQCRLNAAPLG